MIEIQIGAIPALKTKKPAGRKLKKLDKKNTNGAQALIGAIIEMHGGVLKATGQIEKVLKVELHEQSMINWRGRGCIPLRYAIPLAEVWGVPLHALNYKMANAMKGFRNWKLVVKDCKMIGKFRQDLVLTYKYPAAS